MGRIFISGRQNVSELFEAVMVVSFGISWPTSIIKSYKSKTTSGKSILFLLFIFTGYIFGILSKLISNKITYVFVFYIINLCMVFIDVLLYFRNKKLEQNEEN